MVDKDYCPSQGDIIWLDFDPQSGKEQKGRRPAIVISKKIYNGKTGLAICCPITSKVKGYVFEVPIPENMKTKGVIISDQVKSLDWKQRQAEYIESLNIKYINTITHNLTLLIE